MWRLIVPSSFVFYLQTSIYYGLMDSMKRDAMIARLWRMLMTYSLSVLLLTTCVLVLLLVLDSHRLQSPQDIRTRVLRDMVGFDVLAFQQWFTSNSSRHEPDFILR